MKLPWAIQKDVFPENEQKLETILGDRLHYFTMTPEGPTCSLDPPYICYGSIPACRRLQRQGAICWLYDNVYDCSHYLPKLGELALNNPHMFVEYGTFPLLMNWLGHPDVFIKQNSGYKCFTGQKYTEVDKIDLFPEELLLLAQVKKIGAEWRFVISEGKLLTGSLYGDILPQTDPGEFLHSISPLLPEIEPAPIWTLDICEYNGSFKIVEINSLLSAGWYNSEIEKIVTEVDRLANDILPTTTKG